MLSYVPKNLVSTPKRTTGVDCTLRDVCIRSGNTQACAEQLRSKHPDVGPMLERCGMERKVLQHARELRAPPRRKRCTE
jgi:hypothetical protein